MLLGSPIAETSKKDMHGCVITVASIICLKVEDFLVNNLAGDESWFHPQQTAVSPKKKKKQ
jgi:hypothetical protein